MTVPELELDEPEEDEAKTSEPVEMRLIDDIGGELGCDWIVDGKGPPLFNATSISLSLEEYANDGEDAESGDGGSEN